jgi:hypothetical protein
MIELIGAVAIIIASCIGFILLFLLIREIQAQQHPQPVRYVSSSKPHTPPSSSPPPSSFASVYRYNRDNLPSKDTPPPAAPPSPKPFTPSPTMTASPHLLTKLVKLLHGDKKAAERLISHERTKHPGRTMDWYVQEAIDNLLRDRGQ